MNSLRFSKAFVLAGLWLGGLSTQGCRKQVESAPFERLPYPTCEGQPLPEGELLATGHLRSGPWMRDPDVVETFAVRRRSCVHSVVVRQEWPRGVADVEALFDAQLRPLRVWKRLTLPGTERGQPDIRLYELTTKPVRFIERTPRQHTRYRRLRSDAQPMAVLGPGRGLLTLWLWQAKLQVGETWRGAVFDFRGLEQIVATNLRRDADRYEKSFKRKVRVYTVLGRESIYADENDVVIGDLAGLRPHAELDTEPPPPLPRYGPLDTVRTP